MGTLKGFDALMNLVLDDVAETVRGMLQPIPPPRLFACDGLHTNLPLLLLLLHGIDEDGNESTRPLGLVVVRGTLLVLISPVDGSEEIANPFAQPDDE